MWSHPQDNIFWSTLTRGSSTCHGPSCGSISILGLAYLCVGRLDPVDSDEDFFYGSTGRTLDTETHCEAQRARSKQGPLGIRVVESKPKTIFMTPTLAMPPTLATL